MSTQISASLVLAFSLLCGPPAGPAAAQEGQGTGTAGWWVAPLGTAVLEYVGSNSEARGIPASHGGLPIDASLNPLLQYRGGRELIRGDNMAIETAQAVGRGSILSVHLTNRFQLSRGPGGAGSFERVTVREFYATARWGNLRFTGGRSHLFLGQGVQAGIILSNNARALDHLRVESAERFRLPGKLRGLGTHSALLFAGDLGPNQNFPHAKLFGFNWSWRPFETIQVGVTTAVQMGGEGSPSSNVFDVLDNTFPFTHVIFNRQGDVGNKMAGFDFRVGVGRPVEIYGEAVWDDIRALSNFHEAFTEASGYLIGASVRTGFLAHPGRVAIEAHRLFPILYSNTQHTTGWTMDGVLLGDNLGRDAIGLQAWVDQSLSDDSRVSLALAYEIRRGDVYSGATSIFKIVDRPDERRIRGVASLHHALSGSRRLAVEVELGVERVLHFEFATADSRLNYLSRVAISLRR